MYKCFDEMQIPSDPRIYLVGKANGKKWDLAERYLVSLGKLQASNDNSERWNEEFFYPFVSTDSVNYKTHCDPLCYGCIGSSYCASEIQHRFINTAKKAVGLIGYAETTDAFGSIAEMAFASGMGMQMQFLILRSKEYGNIGWDDGGDLSLNDAYWFLSNLPGIVVLFAATDEEEEVAFTFCCDAFLKTDSPIERRLLSGMDYRNMRFPYVQYEVGGYRLDLAFPKHKIAIECDGHEFHKTKEQRGHDTKRDRYLTREGWKIMRFTGTQIYADVESCCDEVAELYRSLDEPISEAEAEAEAEAMALEVERILHEPGYAATRGR